MHCGIAQNNDFRNFKWVGYEIPSMQIHYTSKLLDELPDPIQLKETLDKL